MVSASALGAFQVFSQSGSGFEVCVVPFCGKCSERRIILLCGIKVNSGPVEFFCTWDVKPVGIIAAKSQLPSSSERFCYLLKVVHWPHLRLNAMIAWASANGDSRI
jgi:hypothetical protein